MATRRGMGSVSTLARPNDSTGITRPPGGSLVAALSAADDAGQLRMVRVADVAPHPDNPRRAMKDLDELATSIKSIGLEQPIVVVPLDAFRAANPDKSVGEGARWVVVAGHRRRAAAELGGVEEIAAWIRPDRAGADKAAETFVVENIHRAALEPIEEARAFALLADLGRSQRQIAERLGVSQAHVSKRLSLLGLAVSVQDALSAGQLTVGDALSLTGVPVEDQVAVLDRAMATSRPVSTVVGDLARERDHDRNVAKARKRAAREKIEWIEDVRRIGDVYGRQLYSKADIDAAREAGTLVAGPGVAGVFTYFTTASRSTAADDEEHNRKVAHQARAAAAAELVATRPDKRTAAEATTRAVLDGGIEFAASLRWVHKWLRDSVGITGADMYAWRDSILAGDEQDRTWIAWALTIANSELRAHSLYRAWSAKEAAYLQLLADRVGYEPTPWEQAKLGKMGQS